MSDDNQLEVLLVLTPGPETTKQTGKKSVLLSLTQAIRWWVSHPLESVMGNLCFVKSISPNINCMEKPTIYFCIVLCDWVLKLLELLGNNYVKKHVYNSSLISNH